MKYFILFILFSFQVVNAQELKINKHNSNQPKNIIKNVLFINNEEEIPLTVLYSPFGFWEYGLIKAGFNNYTGMDFLEHLTFGWKSEGTSYKTPNIYYYDTCSVDTIYSVFQTIKCNYANIESIDTSTIVKSIVSPDFIYSNLLSTLPLYDEQFPVFRITYSKYNFPENSIFQCVTILMKDEAIVVNLKTIDASDLFNIEVFNYGNWKLEGNDSSNFINEFQKLNFQNSFDCGNCLDKTYQNHDYIIDYYADKKHFTYFLCDLPINVFPKKDRKTVSNLLNLKNLMVTIQDNIIQEVKR